MSLFSGFSTEKYCGKSRLHKGPLWARSDESESKTWWLLMPECAIGSGVWGLVEEVSTRLTTVRIAAKHVVPLLPVRYGIL